MKEKQSKGDERTRRKDEERKGVGVRSLKERKR